MHAFDQHAHTYEAHAAVQAHAAQRLADWIAPAWRRGEAVELGAGTGFLTRLLTPWEGLFIATDLSQKMLELGRRNAPEARWQKMDAAQPEPRPQAHWIFSSSMLQWLDRPQDALKCWKARFPNARMAVSLFVEGTFEQLHCVLPGHAPLIWRSCANWRSIVESAGWHIDRFESETLVSLYKSPLDFLRCLRNFGGVSPHARVPPARLKTALKRYRERFAYPDGQCPASWHIARILASP